VFHSEVIEPSEVFIVGDTPNDINAAKAIGAVAVNVATGSFSVEQLVEAGSDHAMPSLKAPFPGI
jgi:phosphoglycolate phosphatase